MPERNEISTMQEWLEFLKSNLSPSDAAAILPVERMGALDFEWVPENNDEFELTIKNAPPAILEGLGFVRYNTLPEGPYRHSQLQINNLLGKGCELFLFPGEWYSVIPAGRLVITIDAEVETFKPGISDSGVRAGCLGYGISVRVDL